MTSRLTEIVVDCREPRALAAFWCGVLDYQVLFEEGDEIEIGPWNTGTRPSAEERRRSVLPASILFIRVPEEKQIKNRLHLDVSAMDRSQADEVERVLALGARRIDIGQGEPSWVVLADPEGNEFCILGSLVPQADS